MNNHWVNVFGWFDFDDIYSEAVSRFNNCFFVEVGSFQGKSASYLSALIKAQQKDIKLICVDLFPTTEEIISHENIGAGQSVEKDIIRALPDSLMNVFVKNIRSAGAEDVVIPIKSDSIKASTIFPNNYFGMIFLDDCHYHDYVVEELAAWWSKLRVGGIYAGHDYDGGVKKAVDNFFQSKNIHVQHRRGSWYVVKTFE